MAAGGTPECREGAGERVEQAGYVVGRSAREGPHLGAIVHDCTFALWLTPAEVWSLVRGAETLGL